MAHTFTDEDISKPIENATGEVVGVVTAIEEEAVQVEPKPGVVDSIKAALGWKSDLENPVTVHEDAIDEVTNDVIRLADDSRGRTESPGTVVGETRDTSVSKAGDESSPATEGESDDAPARNGADDGLAGNGSDERSEGIGDEEGEKRDGGDHVDEGAGITAEGSTNATPDTNATGAFVEEVNEGPRLGPTDVAHGAEVEVTGDVGDEVEGTDRDESPTDDSEMTEGEGTTDLDGRGEDDTEETEGPEVEGIDSRAVIPGNVLDRAEDGARGNERTDTRETSGTEERDPIEEPGFESVVDRAAAAGEASEPDTEEETGTATERDSVDEPIRESTVDRAEAADAGGESGEPGGTAEENGIGKADAAAIDRERTVDRAEAIEREPETENERRTDERGHDSKGTDIPIRTMFAAQRTAVTYGEMVFRQGVAAQRSATELTQKTLQRQGSLQRQGFRLARTGVHGYLGTVTALSGGSRPPTQRRTVDEAFSHLIEVQSELFDALERGADSFDALSELYVDALGDATESVRTSNRVVEGETMRTVDEFFRRFHDRLDRVRRTQLQATDRRDERTESLLDRQAEQLESLQRRLNAEVERMQRSLEHDDGETNERSRERRSDRLDLLDGLDSPYRQRLEGANITTLDELAEAEVGTVADAANVSRKRARGWIERAEG